MTWTPDRLFSSALAQLGSNGLSQVRCFFAHPFGHHARLSRRISATGLGLGESPDICFVVSDPLPHGEQACKIQHCVYLILRQQNNDSGFSSGLPYLVEEDSSSFPTGSGQSQMFCSCRMAAACTLRVPCGRVVVQGVRRGWTTFPCAF